MSDGLSIRGGLGTKGRPSIRGRLLGRLTLVFALGMVVLYIAATSYARYAADSSYDRLLLGSAKSIAETLSVTPTDTRVDIPYSALDILSSAPNDRVFYRVIGSDGSTLTGYGDLPAPAHPGAKCTDARPGCTRLFDARYRGESIRIAGVGREVRQAGRSGTVWIEVGQTRAARIGFARDLTVRALLPIAGMTLLAILVVWVSVGRAMRPLDRFGADLARREASDLSPLRHDAPREIVPLIEAVNDFMGRLERTFDVLKVFIADAAHQLRTPLTALLLQMRAAETTAGPAQAASLAEAGRSAERLARLVDQLLGDAMVAHRAQLGHAAVFDLRATCDQALLDCRPLMEDCDIRFRVGADLTAVRGDPVLASEAIKNILHNAIKHGCAPGEAETRIDVAIDACGDRRVLTISDNGTGMTQSELDRVGERFRDAADPAQGSGLGLAIAGDAMRVQGGSMAVANRTVGSGLLVRLEFAAA